MICQLKDGIFSECTSQAVPGSKFCVFDTDINLSGFCLIEQCTLPSIGTCSLAGFGFCTWHSSSYLKFNTYVTPTKFSYIFHSTKNNAEHFITNTL